MAGVRNLTKPFGHINEAEISTRVREGVDAGVRKIERVRRAKLVFDTLRLMEPVERAKLLRQLLSCFGEEAGLKENQ